MAIFTVEKLASLCRVDRETVRRWRHRGINGIKLSATTDEKQRGIGLMFDDKAVRAFMQANPKYLTKELDDILNTDSNDARQSAASKAEHVDELKGGSYVRSVLEQQRDDLLNKLREIEQVLEQMK